MAAQGPVMPMFNSAKYKGGETIPDTMFKPWITVPIRDVHIEIPADPYEQNVKIMFRDADAVDKTIEQLENLREILAGKK